MLGKLFWGIFFIVLGSLIAVLVVLIAAPSTWSIRSFLIERQLLAPVIGVLGVIIAGIIAFGSLLFVHRQIQTYSWRRDQALADIKDIYIPIYEEMDRFVKKMDEYSLRLDKPHVWLEIQGSYRGTKLKLTNEQLYIGLKDFYDGLQGFGDLIWQAVLMVDNTSQGIIEEHLRNLPVELPRETEEIILGSMPVSMDWERRIYMGFLKGNSIREWSRQQYEGDETYLLRWALDQNLGPKVYWELVGLSSDQLENMYDEIFKAVMDNQDIQQKVSLWESYAAKGKRLRKTLDDAIIRP